MVTPRAPCAVFCRGGDNFEVLHESLQARTVHTDHDDMAVSWLFAGSIRVIRPLRGPSRHVLTLQMEVRSRSAVVMSRHIAHVAIHVAAYRF